MSEGPNMCRYNYVVLPSGCHHPTLNHNFTWKGILLYWDVEPCSPLPWNAPSPHQTLGRSIKGTQRIRVFQLLCWHSLQSILMLMDMQISVYGASSVYKLHRANCIRITLSAEMEAIILIKDALIKDCTRMLGSANLHLSLLPKPGNQTSVFIKAVRSHLGTDTRTTPSSLNPRFCKPSTKANHC